MHWFIMVAEEYCDTVLSMRDGGLKNPLIDERDWKACAHEAKEAMARWKM